MRKAQRKPSINKQLNFSKSYSSLWPKFCLSNRILQLPIVLIIVFLIKIGQIPAAILKILTNFIFRLIAFHRRRGRPRKMPLLRFYWQRLRKKINHLVPRSRRWKLAILVVVVTLFLHSFLIFKLASSLPSPYQLTSTNSPLTSQIFDRNGTLLYQFYEGRNRELIKLDDLPPSLIQATLAIEDKHFFSHPGIDPLGIIRALRSNLASNGDAFSGEGGSTITQQLIKNTLLTPDKTIKRKVKEAVLAFWAELVFSKKEILQMYFNEAPYGGPAWGIEAASEMYFGKRAHDLSLAESAFLAGLPAAPTEYSPYGTNPQKSKERQKEVLRRMVEDKYITKAQANDAALENLSIQPPTQEIKAPHFVMYVRLLLAKQFGERTVSQGGLKIMTSLDLNVQEKAEEIVAKEINKLANLKVGNGAAMITDAKNGQILAMVGSKDYFDPKGGNFNVTLALRQPGSAIKPITYATAFKQGFSPGTVLLDTPTTFTNPWGQSYSPVNYDGRFHGPVSIRTALGSSYNIPAVKMLGMVGIPAMLETARDLGIATLTDTKNYGLSLTLGAGAVRMIEMMDAYGTFASGGIRFDPDPIVSITDSQGNVLEDHKNNMGKKVLDEGIAYLITNVLADNKARIPAFGQKSLLEIPGYSVAVKTGTSDNKRDNWTFGFTPEYVVGVWVGNNDNTEMDPKLTSGITGAAPIWHEIMSFLLQDQPNQEFPRPNSIVQINVDGHKDLGIDGQNQKSAASYKVVKQKDEITGTEKEVTIFTDQSAGFKPDFKLNQDNTTQ